MGYYTSHNLKIALRDDPSDIILELMSDCEDAKWAITEDGDSQESCKWYRHEEDLKTFSKKYPEELFVLSGEGEEAGDIWRSYFKNGKMQTCKAIITFDDYSEYKLK